LNQKADVSGKLEAANPPELDRRERKKKALKQHIYNCALDLFMKNGYENTTVDEIAEVADIGRATFFNHYPVKEDVLHEIAAYTVNYARGIFDREFSVTDRNAREKIKRSLHEFGRIFDQNPRHHRSVVLDVMRSQTAALPGTSVPADALISALAEHLAAEQQRGEIKAVLDTWQLAEMLTGIYFYTILGAIRSGHKASIASRCEQAADIFCNGCMPDKD